ncbi:MAG: hypothetical protein SGI71_12615 [Verrucomicrobiota bacterium]|nr:hypothetical protein [Verrucomicrobiota bacterium]
MNEYIEVIFRLVAVFQFILVILNLFLVPLFGWKQTLNTVPLLLKQVFYVHCWFLSFALFIFGVLTWCLSGQIIPGTEISRLICGLIAGFWTLRFILQFTYYSRLLWVGIPDRTLVHYMISFAYGGMACLYWYGAFPFDL